MAYYPRKTLFEYKLTKAKTEKKCTICKCKIKKGELHLNKSSYTKICTKCLVEFKNSPDGTYLGNIKRHNKCKDEEV